MQAMLIRFFLILFILALICPSSLMAARPKPLPEIKSEAATPPEVLNPNASQRESAEVLPGAIAATERRTALVIGNSTYSSGPLKNPVNDATDMAATLKRLGFNVTLHRNANQQTMEDAIREFGKKLKRERGVGLFYYAGHGMQIGGINYLIPIGARVEKETDVKFRAVNAEMILAEMENAENSMNIVLLDACRDNPFGRSFRSASRGLAIISNAPTGTFISYSTGANQLAKDGEGRNSPYTKALLTNIEKPGLTINRVFMNVRSRVMKETGQVPWELSSLVGDFYFHPGIVSESTPSTSTPAADYDTARRKIDEKSELLRQKAALEEEKRKLEEEKQRLAMAKIPAPPIAKEIDRDDRFIAYSDGTVLDTRTNLLWAAKDNGNNVNWQDAKGYCENYRGGGYKNWRMPTQHELAGLYDNSKHNRIGARLTDLIQITHTAGWIWASETEGSRAYAFNFSEGRIGEGIPQSYGEYRALPVRSTAAPKPAEVRRDGRFIAYDDGTVLDVRTSLMWAAKDNGSDINWQNAKRYCENYRGGGYMDWRMPTQDELAGLHDAGITSSNPPADGCSGKYHITELIHLTCCCPWASETRGSEAALFKFNTGNRYWTRQSLDINNRAFPVRSGK